MNETQHLRRSSAARRRHRSPSSRLDPVEARRLRALVEAGYPPALAYSLARSGDLHLAVRLARAGCPVRLAAQIAG